MKELYLKLKEGFQIMLDKPRPDVFEWTFMLSYVGAIAFILLSIALFPGFPSGVFAGLAIDAIYLGVRTLLWIRSSSHSDS